MNEHEARQQRIWLLINQGRLDRAEEELRLYLADHPDHALAHAQLALCLSRTERHKEAHGEAQTAIGLAPDLPFVHYVHSIVLMDAHCLPEAEAAIREAIGLDQSRSPHFAQLATIQLRRQQWQPALESAELGMAIDPGDDECANLRSIALIKLGRKTEAAETLQGALLRDPDDAWTHANLGWSLIEQGRYDDAMTHFREALRLEPNLEHARLGIITALKAQHFLYRPLLHYFLWMQKLNDRYAIAIIIGAFLLMRVLSGVMKQFPPSSLVIIPLMIAYAVFAISSWLGNPLFNLVLFTNRFGRLALSDDERKTSLLVAGSLSVALLFLAGASVMPSCAFTSIGMLLATLPLSKVYSVQRGQPRWIVAGMTSLIMVMSIFPTALILIGAVAPDAFSPAMQSWLDDLGVFCVKNMGLAAIISQFASNALQSHQPRRLSI